MLDSNQSLDFYFHHYLKNKLDVNYGIRKENDQLMMRDQAVVVKDNNNIIVENNVYSSTNDLWALIEINSRSYLRIQMKEVKLKIMMT